MSSERSTHRHLPPPPSPADETTVHVVVEHCVRGTRTREQPNGQPFPVVLLQLMYSYLFPEAVRLKAMPFIEWLQTAESDDE